MRRGKNHGRQPANLHYIGVSVYNAKRRLTRGITQRGANPKRYMGLRPAPLPATGLRYAPSEVGLFLYNEFGSQYNIYYYKKYEKYYRRCEEKQWTRKENKNALLCCSPLFSIPLFRCHSAKRRPCAAGALSPAAPPRRLL